MTALTAASGEQAAPSAETDRTYTKVFWRIVPLLMLCYVVAYLDRVNVGFAKLQMSQDLGFSETVFGLGAGLDRPDHDHVGADVRGLRLGADANRLLRDALSARDR